MQSVRHVTTMINRDVTVGTLQNSNSVHFTYELNESLYVSEFNSSTLIIGSGEMSSKR